MNKIQFNKIYNYLGKDKYAYIVVKRSNCVELTENKKLLIQEIEKMEQNKDFLRINIKLKPSGYFSISNVTDRRKSNSYLLSIDVLNKLSNSINVMVERLVFDKDVIIRPIQFFREQEKRKRENLENRKYNEQVKQIQFATKKTPKSLVEWASKNKKKLEESSTKYEKSLYNSLRKTLKKRIKAQNPYLINGHLYYADMAIPSLKLIIEIDGGYHNTYEQKAKDKQRDDDFKSIGYTTLRYTNEQVESRDGKKKIIQEILSYKSK